MGCVAGYTATQTFIISPNLPSIFKALLFVFSNLPCPAMNLPSARCSMTLLKTNSSRPGGVHWNFLPRTSTMRYRTAAVQSSIECNAHNLKYLYAPCTSPRLDQPLLVSSSSLYQFHSMHYLLHLLTKLNFHALSSFLFSRALIFFSRSPMLDLKSLLLSWIGIMIDSDC